MEITLRKANTIQHSIHEVISNLSSQMSNTISISIYEPYTDSQAKQSKLIENNHMYINELYFLLYKIRKLVDSANYTSGINDLLTESALVTKLIESSEIVTSMTPRDSHVVTDSIIKRMQISAENVQASYNLPSTLSIKVAEESFIERVKEEVKLAKKKRQKIQDKILELNFQTSISISEEDVKILQIYDII